MRIVGLVLLGLALFWNVIRIILFIVGMASGAGANAAPGYMGSFLLGTIAMTALIAFFFVKLLRKE